MSADEPAEESPRPAAADDGGEQEAAAEPAEDGGGEVDPQSPAIAASADEGAARRSKKKKRRAAEPSPEPAADEDDEEAEGAEEGEADAVAKGARRADLPTFAAGFPSDPALDELVRAFEQGDYARVRSEAPALAKRTDRPAVRKAARELARRLNPDPISVYLLVAAVLLLVFLSIWYWTHPHEAPL